MNQRKVIKNVFLYMGSVFSVVSCENYYNKYYQECKAIVPLNTKNSEFNHELLGKLFEIEPYFSKQQLTKFSNISVPFNRKIKEIYELPHYYIEYENYDFNQLSDFFLNIHIFIN